MKVDTKTSPLEDYLQKVAEMKKQSGNILAAPDDYRYQSMEELLVTRGTRFTNHEPFTEDEYHTLETHLGHINTTWKVRECYYNAFRLADWYGPKAPFLYAEGMAVNGPIAVNHAWAVLNGKVVDLTWMIHDYESDVSFKNQTLKHDRMRSPAKLIARMERLRADPEVEYVGIIIPVSAIYPVMMKTGIHPSMIEGLNGLQLLKDGVPKEWK